METIAHAKFPQAHDLDNQFPQQRNYVDHRTGCWQTRAKHSLSIRSPRWELSWSTTTLLIFSPTRRW